MCAQGTPRWGQAGVGFARVYQGTLGFSRCGFMEVSHAQEKLGVLFSGCAWIGQGLKSQTWRHANSRAGNRGGKAGGRRAHSAYACRRPESEGVWQKGGGGRTGLSNPTKTRVHQHVCASVQVAWINRGLAMEVRHITTHSHLYYSPMCRWPVSVRAGICMRVHLIM